jgi:hypothetical protein
MTWSRFDDRYDEHEKIDSAWHAFPPNPVGLHVMATTACNRWLSDGVIRPLWLTSKLPNAKQRKAVLGAMLDLELFDFLPAGQQITTVDGANNRIALGPFQEDRYLVHDFLDRHDSSVQVKERRRKDAERKRAGGKKDSGGIPDGFHADSDWTPVAPRAGAPASAHLRPVPPLPYEEGSCPPVGLALESTGMSNAAREAGQ